MAAAYRRTKKVRKRKIRTQGKEGKRLRRIEGSTPSLKKLLDA
ncbi:MAG TPA: hypothetical protein PKC21_03600 [Oligoflexia bacterium]|nr:hypothetical protein [Oligoflexia bacterium]HMR24421.1 hypothetical protein [Oligoflexia bacterium]